MASDLQWDNYFCLTCDKQTDGSAYCSESCRMVDYESAAIRSPYMVPSATPYYSSSNTGSYLDEPPSRYSHRLESAYCYDRTPSYYAAYASSRRYSGVSSVAVATPPSPSPPSSAATSTTSQYALASTSNIISLPRSYGTRAAAPTTSVTYHHVLSPSSSHSSLSSMQSGMSSQTGGYGGYGRDSSTSSGAISALSAFANGSYYGGSAMHTSSTSNGSSNQAATTLSDLVRSELRKYASSLEQGKLQRDLQRRRSC